MNKVFLYNLCREVHCNYNVVIFFSCITWGSLVSVCCLFPEVHFLCQPFTEFHHCYLFQFALNVVFFWSQNYAKIIKRWCWTEKNCFDLWVWGDKDEAYRGRVQQYLTRSNQCQHYQIHHCHVKQSGTKEKTELFLNAMFNSFLRRKLNPKLQEFMISTLVGHSGFELWCSEKGWLVKWCRQYERIRGEKVC